MTSKIVLGLLAVFAIAPLLVLVFNSLKANADFGSNPLGPPSHAMWSNFSDAWSQGALGDGLRNSAIIVTGTVIGVWLCAGLASYGITRLDLPGKTAVTGYLVIVIALPVQLFLVPLFFLWTRLDLYDTLPGLILIYIALNTPFAILLLNSFLVAIPRELDEAARIDGASEWRVARSIVLPMARPGFLTVGLVVGLFAYNELLLAVNFISSPSKLPISTAFLGFQQGLSREWGLTNAAGLIMVTPMLALFLLLQRHFVVGLASSGVKG